MDTRANYARKEYKSTAEKIVTWSEVGKAEYCDAYVCVCVCLCSHITHPNFIKFSTRCLWP